MPFLWNMTTSSTAQEDPRVSHNRLQLVVNGLYYSVFISPVAVIFSYSPIYYLPEYFGHVPLRNFLIILALQSCAAIFSLYLMRQPLDKIETKLILLQIWVAVTWGLTSWLFWVQGNDINNISIGLLMQNILWSVTLSRGADRRLFTINIVLIATFVEYKLLLFGTLAAQLIGLIMLIWLAHILIVSFSVRRTVMEMLRMRYSNEDLVEALRVARDSAMIGRREAEEANRTKTNFLANMSHELRTPLNAILGFSDMIQNEVMGEKVPDRYREYAKDIHESGSHLLSLINDILDVAKIEAARMEINPTFIDLAAILETIKRLTSPRILSKNQILDYVIAEDIPRLYADERAFMQIVINLVSNANKFASDGGHIRLECSRADDGGFLLTVTDNGIGIAPDRLESIFEPFAQVDNQYNRYTGGTGLGLALVRGLVQLHGGQSWIESEEGAGTKVFIYFPLAINMQSELQLYSA